MHARRGLLGTMGSPNADTFRGSEREYFPLRMGSDGLLLLSYPDNRRFLVIASHDVAGNAYKVPLSAWPPADEETD